MIQFGHNDNRKVGARHRTGEETEEHQNANGETETVHIFGWYLRKYFTDTRGKGATAVICTMIPRNIWREGKIMHSPDSHANWALLVAQ
ncbi:MAG: hypothetical protein JW715_14840 [Sedimentisphaerales bacterium]|nr:hypothetical protein [Sedimentisphaerales bacterium]